MLILGSYWIQFLGKHATRQVGPAFEPHSMLGANCPVRQGVDKFDGRNLMILPSENAALP